MLKLERSKALFEKAKKVEVGGVQDGLRFLDPMVFFKRASGSRLFDVDGNEYIDFHLAFGPLILGHCHPRVTEAVREQVGKGDLYGFGSDELEYEVSEKVVKYVPSADMVRFCNAGTDATFHALRLSRAYTKRKKVIKFEGCYHGWHDYLDVSIMPPAEKVGTIYPESDGIPPEAIQNTVVVPFNDPHALEKAVKKHKEDLAAIILEPIQHNIGCVMPKEGYLEYIREISEKHGVVLIFDEVITGFRHDLGGMQKIYNVIPDLTTLAKSVANGFPIGVVCGREDIMSQLKPLGRVHMAGTYCGNPVSLAAAKATIQELENGKVHKHIFSLGERIRKGLSEVITDLKLKAQVVGYRSIFWIYFTDVKVESYRDLLSVDDKMFWKYHRKMREKGIILAPHPLKRAHLSAAHTKEDADKFVDTSREVFTELKSERA